METTTSARPRRGSIFRRRASTSDTQPKPNLRHAKNASAPSLEPSPAPYHTVGMSASTDSLLSVNGTRANIIPDALESLPSWYNKEIDVPSSIHLIRARYPIHNPAGPRFYRNVHLRPPELLPPMEAFTSTVPSASASASASQAGPSSSRTTSTSPAPTPASSTSKLVDPSIKPRTRKLSNNVAHDNVDLLDVTDPLGNNWHHTSPYDALAAPSPVSPDGADRGPRSRLPSAASRPKTNAPSPLSQSTSAVHLAQEPDVRPKQKRRRTFKGVFSTRDDIDIHPQPSSSEPTTPFERGASPYLAVPQVGHKHKSSRVPRGLKSVSTTSIPHIANSIFGSHDKDKSGKREKRGSVLGKLARGFSVLRRPTHSRGSSDVTGLSISDRMSMGTDPSRLSSVPPASGRHLSPEKGEARRRVPVPSVEPSTATSLSAEPEPPAPPQRASNTRQYDEYVYDDDGQSVLSVDASYTGGRLTIVNPDIPRPDEVEDSPVSTLMPLRATSPVAHPPSVQVHVQAEIAGMARIQSIKRTSAEVPDAPQPPAAHPHSHSHSVRPPSQQSTHSRSASSRLSSQHGGRHSANNHASHHHRIEKELPVPTPTPPPFITTEISTSPITLSRPLSVLSPPPVLAPELKPSHSRDSHRSSRKPPSSSSSAPAPTPAPSQPSIPMSPPAQAPVPTPASSTDTVTPTTASVASPPPASNSALPPSPFRRDKAASQPMVSPPFIPFPTDLGTPLSRASLLVNPPTPTAGPVPIPPVARMPSVFARRAKEKEKDAPSGPRSRSGSTSPTKHEDEEKERKEKEREAKEKEERERRERERRAEKERLERERAELDRRVREKERQLELERERLEVERRVREKEREIELERERERERERKRAEEKERERMARERERAAEKERLEHERLELERRLWERAERERLERERQQREQVEREKAEKERVEREKRREEERLERERRRDEERRREDDRRREKEEHDRRERDERDRRERERSRERRRERERSRERRKEHEREERDRSRERREREKEKERKRALEKEMYREEREREKERERARSRSPFAKRAATSSGAVGSAKARETETFRLVRTLSGGNGISGTTIVAEGQHYELVGDAPKRSKTTSKEDPSRRGSRREKDKEREHRSEDSPAKPVSPFSAHVRSASSPVAPTRKESTRRKPNDLPRLRERQPSTSSASNRPTSDLPSAADLHAVRARDAWEMDRLWRGHSAVYDPSLMYAQSIAAGSTSTVQGGMPMSPPQSGVFESPYMHGNLAAFTGHTPNYVFPSGLRSFPDLGSIPSIASPEPEARELRSPMRNPLPSPPKPSAFRLPPRVELKDHGLTAPS